MTGGRGRSQAPWRGRFPGRDRGWARPALAGAAVALGLLAGCGGSSSSPTLDAETSISLSRESLVPVSGGLCHVRGTLQNLSVVKVNVTLQWQALDSSGNELGTTSLTLSDLTPGETRAFESTGFVNSDATVPCSKVVTFPLKQTTVTRA